MSDRAPHIECPACERDRPRSQFRKGSPLCRSCRRTPARFKSYRPHGRLDLQSTIDRIHTAWFGNSHTIDPDGKL